jgi:hypothetical protein
MTIKITKLLITLISLIILALIYRDALPQQNKKVKLKVIAMGEEIIEVDKNSKSFGLIKKDLEKIEGLENLTQLEELSLQMNRIRSLDWIPKQIKRLHLNDNKLHNLDGIDRFTQLQEIYLDNNYIENIDDIFKLKSLKILEINVNIVKIIKCSNNDSIEKINLTNNKLINIYHLNKLRKLKRLSLFANPIEQDKELIKKLKFDNPNVEIRVRE